ncbi:MAG: 16S rRNA (guanine(966)-N(2))-methyltransferase RsmD [Wenzhouxiangellaceae bacterium]|nr:16S rRNA (guanine(966)-N(2))-methyltransferase RsmD [Wenzhouxiangellaceae bacterium]
MAGKLRIIGGQWRGRRLPVPDVPGLRPTGDRAREVLFNWLRDRVRGARCLDLFAGTGALGLEAASRGAASVTLVERDRKLAALLARVAAEWPAGDVLHIVRGDALVWLARETESSAESQDPSPGGAPFDLVFVDPPFDAGLYATTLAALRRPGLLAAGARIYVESAARSPAPVVAGETACVAASSPCLAADFADPGPAWEIVREKRVGDVRMQLLAVPGG